MTDLTPGSPEWQALVSASKVATVPAPFEALRLVEHDGPDDTMRVQVALTAHAWRECVSAIGRAIVSGRLPTHRMLAAGAPGIDGIHAAQAITRAVLAPSWTITGEAAEALALDLSEAAEEPADCARCDRWVDIDGAYCSGCER